MFGILAYALVRRPCKPQQVEVLNYSIGIRLQSNEVLIRISDANINN